MKQVFVLFIVMAFSATINIQKAAAQAVRKPIPANKSDHHVPPPHPQHPEHPITPIKANKGVRPGKITKGSIIVPAVHAPVLPTTVTIVRPRTPATPTAPSATPKVME